MLLFVFIALLGFTASFVAKLLADSFLDHRIAIVGQEVGLQYSRNPGIAFGIRLPPMWQEIFIGVALLFVLWLALRSDKRALPRIGYGLIVGGALGNIIDRVRDGFVTDFIQVGSFPIFNIADSCITVGVVLLLLDTFVAGRKKA